ncbi:MAG: GNAT family N-acetyltransferase [Phycisphaerales bacterium]
MRRRLPHSIDTFDDAVGPALRRAPVLNQVELGIIDNVRADPGRYPNGVRMVAVRDVTTDEIGLAIQTPPHKPLVSVAADTVAFELGRRFADLYPETRSVFGTERTAGAFARGAGAGDIRRTSHDGVYELRRVGPLPAPSGRARIACAGDAPLLQSWLDAFVEESLPAGFPKDPKAGARFADGERTWIWVDDAGTPVSMAHNGRRIAGWWAVAYVYTPPAHRGHGFATAVVAHTSRWALSNGAEGCTLFTDLANPVSNRIYERIGYVRVGTRATLEW